MGVPEAVPDVQDRVRFDGEFASPELEAAYRRRNAPHDLLLGRVMVGTATLVVLALGLLDPSLVPNETQRAWLLGARLAFFVCSVVALILLRGRPSPARFERVLGGWYCLTVALQVYGGSVWPAGHIEIRMSAALAVLMSYCVMPLRFRLQAAGAILFTAGSLLVTGWLNPAGDSVSLIGEVSWLATIHVLGAFLSYRLHARQRLLFAAMLRQAEMSASLSRALAEVRTLRGLIRVCAWCRKVDAGGDWQQLEAYIRDHSHAEFTHGICPVCMAAASREIEETVV